MTSTLSESYLIFYLLPGFITYAIIYRLLDLEGKKDYFDVVFFSLFLSIIINIPLSYLESEGLISLHNPDWVFYLVLSLTIPILSVLITILIRYALPRLQKFTQLFDKIKSTKKDILSYILEDKIDKDKVSEERGIWLMICTKDNKIFSGYVNREGLFNNETGIYLKKVKLNRDPEGYGIKDLIEKSEGVLFLQNQIKWISILTFN